MSRHDTAGIWVAFSSQHASDIVAADRKALSKEYLAEDFDLFDWSLDDSEMARLNAATTPPITGTPPQKPDDYNDCQVP